MKKLIKYLILVVAFFVGNSLTTFAQNRWEGFGLTFDRPITCFYSDTTENVLYMGGEFKTVNSIYVRGIIKWDGISFHSLGLGVDQGSTPEIYSVTKYQNDIYVCGNIANVNNFPINGITKWNGVKWDSLQSGVTEINHLTHGVINSMVIYNNELCVAGSFSYAGDVPALSVARWNGSTWSDMYGYPGYITKPNEWYLLYTMATFNNELYVGGSIEDSSNNKVGIMRWTGIKWEVVGGGIIGNQSDVYCMAVYKNELYVGGCFNKADGNIGNGIQKWDGQTWKEVGDGVTLTGNYFSAVQSMYVYNNILFATGAFDKAGSITTPNWLASWDGSKWCTLTKDTFGSPATIFTEYQDTLILYGGFIINNDTNLTALVKYLEPSFTDSCSQTYGVPEIVYENGISIFPNPATNYFIITTENNDILPKTVNIYTIEGVLVKQEQFTDNEISIETSTLVPGLYIIEVQTSKNHLYHKLLISH